MIRHDCEQFGQMIRKDLGVPVLTKLAYTPRIIHTVKWDELIYLFAQFMHPFTVRAFKASCVPYKCRRHQPMESECAC